jgi:uncharacterized membrane protein/nitrite reductase/ring-hydroxylating ferredoxin subunit
MMKDLLQGRPFGHPLHPMLVHLPIALLLGSFLFDIAALAWSDRFVRPSFYAMALGVLTALLAAAPGLADYSDIRRDHPGRKTATWHMILNLAAVALYLINLALRWGRVDENRIGALSLLLSVIGVGLLSVSGYLGGVLVYDEGIGVGRHRRKGRTPRETIVKAGIRDEWVEVADSSSLEEGQTLRATINGVTMAIASANGRPCAFQEFCTHRYGPLSEGALHDGEVTCPWHGSRFEVKSGEVTQGPAKEAIRTFDAQIREGKVHVRAPEP